MPFELQPRIQNQWIKLELLEPGDFDGAAWAKSRTAR
jgi:hypothetical protein